MTSTLRSLLYIITYALISYDIFTIDAAWSLHDFNLVIIAGEVLGDVDLIWCNCRSFNEPGSEISDLADQAQQAFRIRWQQEGLPTVDPINPLLKTKKQSGKKRALEAGESCPSHVRSCDWLSVTWSECTRVTCLRDEAGPLCSCRQSTQPCLLCSGID